MENKKVFTKAGIIESGRYQSDKKRKRFDWFRVLLLAPMMIYLILFLVLPALIMLVFSFGTMTGASMSLTTELTTANYLRLAQNPLYVKVVLNSLKLSFAVVVIALLVGYPTAYWLATRSRVIKFVFLCLMLVPFWTSVLLRTYAWQLMLQDSGPINAILIALHITTSPFRMLWSEGAVIVACLQIYLPFMIIPLYAVLEMQDRRLVDAAKNLGASKVRAFLEITLPLSIPGLVVGIIFVFVPVVGEYLIPFMLGGTSFPVASQVIKSNFGITFNWPLGCALAVILSVLICAAVFGLLRVAPPWKLLTRRRSA
jgi:spermidine/putrescine transport system permease protein